MAYVHPALRDWVVCPDRRRTATAIAPSAGCVNPPLEWHAPTVFHVSQIPPLSNHTQRYNPPLAERMKRRLFNLAAAREVEDVPLYPLRNVRIQ
jgi:hypothetical protein